MEVKHTCREPQKRWSDSQLAAPVKTLSELCIQTHCRVTVAFGMLRIRSMELSRLTLTLIRVSYGVSKSLCQGPALGHREEPLVRDPLLLCNITRFSHSSFPIRPRFQFLRRRPTLHHATRMTRRFESYCEVFFSSWFPHLIFSLARFLLMFSLVVCMFHAYEKINEVLTSCMEAIIYQLKRRRNYPSHHDSSQLKWRD